MIDINQALLVHDILLKKFGGKTGIRDSGALESAINRPQATFEGKELYPSAAAKAAALLESLLNNHPFVDGNKRTGYVLTRLLLIKHGFDFNTDENERYDFIISIASGKSRFEEIETWIEQNIRPL